jgi:hypothetical protein
MKALVAFALIASSCLQGATHDLLWKPKAGQKLVYAISINGELMSKPFLFSADVHMDIKKVEANGDYTLGTTYKNGISKALGETDKLPEDPEELQKFNARGEPLDEDKPGDEEDDAFGEIMARAGDFYKPAKPVAIGDTWTHEYPADKKMGLPKATGTYKLVGLVEDKLKVSIEYRETTGVDPTVAKGFALIKPADGTLTSVESDIENARVQEGVPPAKVKLTLKLK